MGGSRYRIDLFRLSLRGLRGVVALLAFLTAGAAATASTVYAADGAEQSMPRISRPEPPRPPRETTPDFFLGQPRAWVSVRGGLLLPRADAQLFTFLSDQLTVKPSDFRSRTFDLELGIMVTPKLAIEGGFDVARRTIDSEYRDFVRANRDPITQQTQWNQTGFNVGVRFAPLGHGQRVSSLSFLPRRITPYAGAGLQAIYYTFHQNGSFVDFADLSIFNDVFGADGWTAGPYARGGVDIQLWRHLFVNADVRYMWLRTKLSSDFQGFADGIDLASVRTSTGISIKF